MSKATVHSSICGFDHRIEGKRVGQNIVIDIVTPCEKIQKMSHMEIPSMQIFDIKDNYVMNKAQEWHNPHLQNRVWTPFGVFVPPSRQCQYLL